MDDSLLPGSTIQSCVRIFGLWGYWALLHSLLLPERNHHRRAAFNRKFRLALGLLAQLNQSVIEIGREGFGYSRLDCPPHRRDHHPERITVTFFFFFFSYVQLLVLLACSCGILQRIVRSDDTVSGICRLVILFHCPSWLH